MMSILKVRRGMRTLHVKSLLDLLRMKSLPTDSEIKDLIRGGCPVTSSTDLAQAFEIRDDVSEIVGGHAVGEAVGHHGDVALSLLLDIVGRE